MTELEKLALDNLVKRLQERAQEELDEILDTKWWHSFKEQPQLDATLAWQATLAVFTLIQTKKALQILDAKCARLKAE